MRRKQRGPAIRDGMQPAQKLGTPSSYPHRQAATSSQFLPPGARLAAYWLDAGNRCVSSVYRYFTDANDGPEMKAIIQSAVDDDLIITPDLFGSPTQGNLLRILVGCHQAGLPLTVHNIIAMAAHLGWPILDDGGDERACLRRVLGCESSAAGLTTWPIHLRDCAVRRQMTRDLSAIYSRILIPTEAVQEIIEQLIANTDAWRTEARGMRDAA